MARRVPVKVHYHNAMARGVYELTEREGRNFHPDFRPDLTPQQMLQLGVFNGRYLNSCTDEYPRKWFTGVRLSDRADPQCNYYGVRCSLSLSAWRAKGWIDPRDPRGWFEWWCRYYMGRRCNDGYDELQIRRWKQFYPRHVGALKKHDSPRRRQALLHWAYDARRI